MVAPPTVHDTAIVADYVELGEGAVIGPWALLGVDGPPEAPPLQLGPGAIVRSHAVLYRGSTFGSGLHVSHGALVREATEVGDHVSIGSHTIVEHHVQIGHGVRLHSNCFVPEHSVLGAGCWLGPNVVVTNARYPNRPDTKDHLEGVQVGEGAVIGAGSVLLPGVRIGERALVGAGAVVVRDVLADAVIVGNPGREVQR